MTNWTKKNKQQYMYMRKFSDFFFFQWRRLRFSNIVVCLRKNLLKNFNEIGFCVSERECVCGQDPRLDAQDYGKRIRTSVHEIEKSRHSIFPIYFVYEQVALCTATGRRKKKSLVLSQFYNLLKIVYPTPTYNLFKAFVYLTSS